MADNGRQLILIFGHFENSSVHADLAARHGESIDLILLENRQFPLDVAVGRVQLSDNRLCDAGDKIDFGAIGRQRQASPGTR